MITGRLLSLPPSPLPLYSLPTILFTQRWCIISTTTTLLYDALIHSTHEFTGILLKIILYNQHLFSKGSAETAAHYVLH